MMRGVDQYLEVDEEEGIVFLLMISTHHSLFPRFFLSLLNSSLHTYTYTYSIVDSCNI